MQEQKSKTKNTKDVPLHTISEDLLKNT